MSTEKETRVFVVRVDEMDECDDELACSSSEISAWNNGESLPENALRFIEISEEQGNVYSLERFAYAFNSELVSTFGDLIFITDKY